MFTSYFVAHSHYQFSRNWRIPKYYSCQVTDKPCIPQWVHRLSMYPQYMQFVHAVSERLDELGKRIDILKSGKREQKDIYSNDRQAEVLAAHRARLNHLSARLTTTTAQFFEIARNRVSGESALVTQQKALGGLRTFSASLEAINSMKSQSVDDDIKKIEEMVRMLGKEINK